MEQHHSRAYIDDVITRFLAEGLEAEEQAILEQWVEADAANRAHFIAMRDAWMLSMPQQPGGRYDAGAAWAQMAAALPEAAVPAEEEPVLRPAGWKRLLRVAAMLLLAAGLGGGMVYVWLRPGPQTAGQENKWITVVSPRGATTQIRLSDGTRVWLNAGSTLQYPQAYDLHSREVKLEGEAFFQVRTNAARPFRVNTAGLEILALGTSFNVKAYPEDSMVVTTLVEGRVKINGHKDSRPFSIELKPRQHVTYHVQPAAAAAQKAPQAPAAAAPVESNEVSNTDIYTGWKDGSWIISAQSLEELAVVMERRFNVKVVFADESLKHYKFSGTFRQETLEQVLNILKLTAPLNYTIDNGVVTLLTDKERKEKFSKALPTGH